MSRSVKSTGSKARTGVMAQTQSSNRHFSKTITVAPTKEALQMQLREFDFRASNWQQVEFKFRELHSLLSAPTSGLNAAQERIQQKESVSSALVTFLDMCQAECRRLLAEGKEKAAVEGGLTTLNLKREYYGSNSLQLVSAFFHLARTNQCLGHIKRAEEFLSLAQLQVMRHPEADASLKAELHQIYGLLYAADGRQDQALKHLTCAAYYLSQLNGPEHILTSFCYFDLGNVFAALNHMENTMAFYEKVKDIWYAFLSSTLRRMLEVDRQVRAAEDEELAAAIAANAENIMGEYSMTAVGADNVQDAAKMLHAIVLLQRDRFGVVHPVSARAELISGMLLIWTGDRTPAYETIVRANEISKRSSGERHAVTIETAELLKSFGWELPSDAALSVDELVRDLEQQKISAEMASSSASGGGGNNSSSAATAASGSVSHHHHHGGSSSIAQPAQWQPSALADLQQQQSQQDPEIEEQKPTTTTTQEETVEVEQHVREEDENQSGGEGGGGNQQVEAFEHQQPQEGEEVTVEPEQEQEQEKQPQQEAVAVAERPEGQEEAQPVVNATMAAAAAAGGDDDHNNSSGGGLEERQETAPPEGQG